jgi:hypothetical protein
MKACEKFGRGLICLMVVCLWVTPLLARQAEAEKPKPAGRQYPPAIDTTADQQHPGPHIGYSGDKTQLLVARDYIQQHSFFELLERNGEHWLEYH